MSRGDMTTLPPAARRAPRQVPDRDTRRSRPRRPPDGAAGVQRAAAGSGARERQPAASPARGTRVRSAATAPRPNGTGVRGHGTSVRGHGAGMRGNGAGVRGNGTGPAGTRLHPLRAPVRTRPGTSPSGPAPGRGPVTPVAAPARESRTRFVFLVLGLLGGALVCLLLINTVLATGSLQITALQQANVQLDRQHQVLQAQVSTEEAPAALYQRARQLGMVSPPLAHFLDLRKGRIISQPTQVPDVKVYPPGYTP